MSELPWAVSLMTVFCVGPGLVAVWAFQVRTREPKLNLESRATIVAVAIAAAITHAVALSVSFVLPVDHPDIELIWNIFALPSDAGLIARAVESLRSHVTSFVAYVAATYLFGTIAGVLLAAWHMDRIELTPLERALQSPSLRTRHDRIEDANFTVLDVLTTDGRLYRGLYHSRFPTRSSEGNIAYLNLACAARWVGRNYVVPKLPGDAVTEGVDTKAEGSSALFSGDIGSTASDGVSGFKDITSSVNFEELMDILLPDLFGCFDEDRARAIVDDILSSPALLADYAVWRVNLEPDLMIPWKFVANINARHFSVSDFSARGSGDETDMANGAGADTSGLP